MLGIKKNSLVIGVTLVVAALLTCVCVLCANAAPSETTPSATSDSGVTMTVSNLKMVASPEKATSKASDIQTQALPARGGALAVFAVTSKDSSRTFEGDFTGDVTMSGKFAGAYKVIIKHHDNSTEEVTGETTDGTVTIPNCHFSTFDLFATPTEGVGQNTSAKSPQTGIFFN